jgi:hypothetical protein
VNVIAHLKTNNTASILDAYPFDFNDFATSRKIVRDIKTHWGFNGIKSKSTETESLIHVTLHGLKCHIVIHLETTNED